MQPVVGALLRHAEPASEAGMRVSLNLRQLAEAAGLSMLEAHRGLQQLVDRKLAQIVDEQLMISDREALDALFGAPQ